MFTTPQKRGGASTLFGGSPSTPIPNTKGLFSDGIWYCNCQPRLPATKFQVHKQTRNHGRWFYTCQLAKDNGGCGFFLWNEEAMIREGKVVLANSRSEETPEVGRTPRKTSAVRNDRTPTARRGSNVEEDLTSDGSEDEEEFGSWPSTENNAGSLDMTKSQDTLSPETPRKASKMALFTTPGSKRKRDYDHDSIEDNSKIDMDGLPTPITGGGLERGGRRIRSMSEYGNDDEDIFSTPSSLRTASHNNSFGIRSPSSTPTPFANNFQPNYPPSVQESRQDIPAISSPYDVTPDVLNLLREEGVLLDEETKGKLNNLLKRHAMRVSGIAKGRDITRVALKSKDAKIAELGLRIGQLETEKEVDRRLIAGLRSEKVTSKGRVMW